jgi:hypothetical protein
VPERVVEDVCEDSLEPVAVDDNGDVVALQPEHVAAKARHNSLDEITERGATTTGT